MAKLDKQFSGKDSQNNSVELHHEYAKAFLDELIKVNKEAMKGTQRVSQQAREKERSARFTESEELVILILRADQSMLDAKKQMDDEDRSESLSGAIR